MTEPVTDFDATYELDDRYRRESGRVYLSGVQALVRLPLLQRARDRAAGLDTRGFISGYRGSPLGTYDMALWQARGQLEEHGVRFEPGVKLGNRYRIVGLLGRGGMGEVYRADDVKLGQPVALKFLPSSVANDQERLNRLLTEVKIARQVSHPNVCRVYDVGEAGAGYAAAARRVADGVSRTVSGVTGKVAAGWQGAADRRADRLAAAGELGMRRDLAGDRGLSGQRQDARPRQA